MSEFSVSKRRKARFLSVQALYQWAMGESELIEIESQFRRFNDMSQVDGEYLKQLIFEVPKHVAELDGQIERFTDRKISIMNPIDVQILRVAVYELIYSLEVPYRVVINEAVDLAKTFASDESHGYINGILDNLAKELRKDELNSR